MRVSAFDQLEKRIQALECSSMRSHSFANIVSNVQGVERNLDTLPLGGETELLVPSQSSVPEHPWIVVNRRGGVPSSAMTPGTVGRLTERKPNKSRKTFCDGTDCAGHLKAGVPITKKAVVHVNNMDISSTADEISGFLKDNNVNVLSCFVVKSWLRTEESSKVTAFRVCVEADQKDNLINKMLCLRALYCVTGNLKSSNHRR